MDFTPNDMRNHEFGTQLRGFDKAEVKAFVDKAAEVLEQTLNRIQQFKNENEKVLIQYQQLKDLEDTIRSAVLEAQKNANQIIANAKREAELIVTDARQKRDQLIEERKRDLITTEEKIQKLRYQRDAFYSKLKSEVEAHLKLINSIVQDTRVEHPEPETIDMKAEEVIPDEEETINNVDIPVETPAKPAFEMKEDELDAALSHLSGGDSSRNTANMEAGQSEPIAVESSQPDSELNKGIQDGKPQSKGYDF